MEIVPPSGIVAVAFLYVRLNTNCYFTRTDSDVLGTAHITSGDYLLLYLYYTIAILA
jgi:hypothetical protein